MKTLYISVTQKNISCGIRGDCNSCPVAFAFNDHPDVGTASVIGESVALTLVDGTASWFPLLAFVQNRISTFDYEGTMDPFEFALEVPDGK